MPEIPFWLLVFKNIHVHFLGRDDFTAETRIAAVAALNDALATGWPGLPIAERVPLAEIARAHELVEGHSLRGRVIVTL